MVNRRMIIRFPLRIVFPFLSLFLFSCLRVQAQEIPAINSTVTDNANVLSVEQEQFFDRHIRTLYDNSKVQVAVLTIDTTQPLPIEDFGIQVAEKWAGGEKGEDLGVIFILAIQDRGMRIELGEGMEGYISDGQSRLILDSIKPTLQILRSSKH